MRDALGAMVGIAPPVADENSEITKARAALSERMANLKRLHFPPGLNVSKAAKAEYKATAIASLALAVHLENMHLNPRVVIRALADSEANVWKFAAVALSCAGGDEFGYAPAGEFLLLFAPNGLDDLGTKAARAGRYNVAPSPSRLVHTHFKDSTRIHGICIDSRVLGMGLTDGLGLVGVDAGIVSQELWLKSGGTSVAPTGTTAGYRANAKSLLNVLQMHPPGEAWSVRAVTEILVLLNAMARGGADAAAFANASINATQPLIGFREALQGYMELLDVPVIPNRSQPASIGMMYLLDALGVRHDNEIQPRLLERLSKASL
ncbi:hypothetical protein [Sphingomonas sp. BAUL-RG-20F-R05-02]|uniref:hypothetical protein n=1 Tax=Sphingomonas sp. BAUL-RG-20F-R05-02 TaxID=2914830 RepID=UPI001F578EE1|nr:hypothetical protein [Sphingomonas sp. BAUL-RG-20F-R05-02]